jgi:hypothetical protein
MRRRMLVLLLVTSVLVALAVSVFSLQQVTAAPANIEVGTVPGVIASEFVGRVDQNGVNFVAYGYLTHLSGLTGTLLFSSTNPQAYGESTARITYYATTTLTARSVISGVSGIDSLGQTTYYFNAVPAATFGNPNSFKSGVPIFTATARYQDVLNLQAPNLGIATGAGDLTETGNAPFTLNAQTYQLGRVGMLQRVSTTGEGTRTDPVTPKSFVVQAGYTVLTALPGSQSFVPLIFR